MVIRTQRPRTQLHAEVDELLLGGPHTPSGAGGSLLEDVPMGDAAESTADDTMPAVTPALEAATSKVAKWRLTVQQTRAHPAHCWNCKLKFPARCLPRPEQ